MEACLDEVYVPVSEEQIRHVAAMVHSVGFRRYVVDSSALLGSLLFSASDTDRGRTRWLAADDDVPLEDRHLIAFGELMELPELLAKYVAMLDRERRGRPERPIPRIMTLHCSRCDARWLLDGNHGFVRLCVSGEHQETTVTEMTGPGLGMRGCRC